MPPPRLAEHQIATILDCSLASWRPDTIANAAKCTTRTVYRIQKNMRVWGEPYPPRQSRGPAQRALTAYEEDVLLNFLDANPTAYLDEMAWFLHHTCGVVVHITTVWRTLQRRGWSRTYVRRRAAERCLFTKAIFRGRMLAFNPRQLVFLDESGADERTGWRSYGWSPTGIEAVVNGSIQRSPRWSILPAYTLDGYMDGVLIEQVTINAEVLLRWLQESVLPQLTAGYHIIIMDNASIHRVPEIRQAIQAAGVLTVYLPPYCPELNPIEHSFHDIKAWIRRNFHNVNDYINFGFFLRHAIREAISPARALSHFRKAGYCGAEEPVGVGEDDV